MRPAPLAVLAQRDAIGVVALALVRLVVAPLALLAGEGDSDAHVSAGHTPLRDEDVGRPTALGTEKGPAPGESESSVARITRRRCPRRGRARWWGDGSSGGSLPPRGRPPGGPLGGVCVGARASGVEDALSPPRAKVT